MDTKSIETFLSTTAIDIGIKILAAIAFWAIGRWLIGLVVSLMQRAMNRNHVDPTLTKYLGSIVAVMLNIALVLGILGYFGIQTTSFAALIAGAGDTSARPGAACSATSAAGAFMLVLRPFKVGDFVSAGGVVGTVKELGLFGDDDRHAGQRGHAGRQRQGLRRRHPELFGQPGARCAERTAQLAGGGVDALDALARLKAAVAAIPNVVQNPAPEVNAGLQPRRAGEPGAPLYCHTDHYWQVY